MIYVLSSNNLVLLRSKYVSSSMIYVLSNSIFGLLRSKYVSSSMIYVLLNSNLALQESKYVSPSRSIYVLSSSKSDFLSGNYHFQTNNSDFLIGNYFYEAVNLIWESLIKSVTSLKIGARESRRSWTNLNFNFNLIKRVFNNVTLRSMVRSISPYTIRRIFPLLCSRKSSRPKQIENGKKKFLKYH